MPLTAGNLSAILFHFYINVKFNHFIIFFLQMGKKTQSISRKTSNVTALDCKDFEQTDAA
jgi:hypothetical protein